METDQENKTGGLEKTSTGKRTTHMSKIIISYFIANRKCRSFAQIGKKSTELHTNWK
jgi:hypothetical protein